MNSFEDSTRGIMNWSDYPNFSPDEFECRCGCGGADMDADFMAALQRLRDAVGFPLTITSGFRCAAYNARVSSTGADGPHTTGKAADIAVRGREARTLLAMATEFTGLGVAQKGPSRFIHLDTLTDGGRPWVWSY